MITYEYPLNERVRTLLRLEDLYDRVQFFLGNDPTAAPDSTVDAVPVLSYAPKANPLPAAKSGGPIAGA